MIDYHCCVIEQIETSNYNPDELTDIIFDAKDKRMEGFSPTYDDIYRPLEGMTSKECEYLLQHEFEIDRSLHEMTQHKYHIELFERSKKVMKAACKRAGIRYEDLRK